jgi:hypothetical protein
MSDAGWWPDPLGRHELRYHDGARWTEHVATGGVGAIDPIAPVTPPAATPAALPAPEPASAPSAGRSDAAAGQPLTSPPSGAPASSPFASPPAGGVPFGSTLEPPPPLIQEAGAPKRLLLLAAAVVVVVLAVAVGVLLTRGGDSTTAERGETIGTGDATAPAPEPAATATVPVGSTPVPGAVPGTTAIAPPDTSPPPTSALAPGATAPATLPPTAPPPPPTSGGTAPGAPPLVDPGGAPVPVGTAVAAAGDVVRVNRIVADAPGDDFFQPEAGNTITEVEVEVCAGADGFWSNSFAWTAYLDDGTEAEHFLFGDDIPTYQLAAGGCARGIVGYEVPDGRTVTEVAVLDLFFSETARFTADGAVEPVGRLAPPTPPIAAPIGTPQAFGAGHTATVRAVRDGAPPLDDLFPPAPGRQYNIVEVELCAGSEPLTVTGLFWHVAGTDHRGGTSILTGDTLPFDDVAAGQCITGEVQIDVSAGTTTAYVVYADDASSETARWSVG